MRSIIPWIIIAVLIFAGISYSNPEIIDDIKSQNIIKKLQNKTEDVVQTIQNSDTSSPTIKKARMGDIINDNDYVDTGEIIKLTGVYTKMVSLLSERKGDNSIKDSQGYFLATEKCKGKSRTLKSGTRISVVGQVKTYSFRDVYRNTHIDLYFECTEPLKVI